MQAYAKKNEKMNSKSVLKEEQQGFGPESSGIINLADSGRSLDLPDTLRSRVRTQFGLNMDSLRVRESAQVADLGANAMAQGNIISFAPGVFNPNTSSGQEIIGHELHHITEQARGLGSNIEGSNIHYNPSSESASDAAGRAFASGFTQGEGAGFAPSVTPVAASAAPVQGNRFIFSKIFSYFTRRRPQQQNQVTVDQPVVQPGDQLGVQPGDQSEVQPVVQPNPNQSSQPVPPDQSAVSDPSAPQGSGSLPANQPPAAETPSDKKLNKKIYEMENNFLPSPNSGIFKKLMTENDADPWLLTKLFTGTNEISKMRFRRRKGIKRGMTKAQIDEKENNNVILSRDAEILHDYYGKEGDYHDVFDAKTDGGIDNGIKMTYHADAKNDMFSYIREKRLVTNYTYLLNSNLREFVRKNKQAGLAKKDRNDLFGREVYRSIILDVMKERDDVKGKGYNRDTLKAIYEKLHVIKKDKEKSKMDKKDPRLNDSSSTGLDVDMTKLPSVSDDQREAYENIEGAMSNLMEAECGHSWIETNSYDKQNNHRVRFTMGFWPDKSNSEKPNPLSKRPGTVKNPDTNDNKVGSSSRTDTIDREGYLKALKFAKNFNKGFSLSGKIPGTANCTGFASGMANAAGMKVQSSKRMLPGKIHSPDVAAKDSEMTKASKSEYEMGSEHYSEITVPKEANINDSKTGELLMEACQKSAKYTTVFKTLSENLKITGNIVLREKLLESFRNGSSVKKAFILTALHNFSKNNILTDTLEVFIDLVIDDIKSELKNASDQKSIIEELNKEKTEEYLKENDFTRAQGKAPLTSAKALFTLLDAEKEKLQQELIKISFLDQKWQDPTYADAVVRALATALEIHLPAMHALFGVYEGNEDRPKIVVSTIDKVSNKQTLIDEFNRVFSEYTGGDLKRKKAYDEMYFT